MRDAALRTIRASAAAAWARATVALWALAVLGGCSARDQPREYAPAPSTKTFAATVNQPPKLTSIETNQKDANGNRARIACATCHTLRDAGPLPQSASDLKQFHAGLQLQHGSLACASCHVQGRSDALHLADGKVIAMENAIDLCAQCHGPQYRDYKAGSHGGMTGSWDLSRGPRSRNHCVDCHEAHAPRYPGTRPVLKPNDRIPPNPKEPGHG